MTPVINLVTAFVLILIAVALVREIDGPVAVRLPVSAVLILGAIVMVVSTHARYTR